MKTTTKPDSDKKKIPGWKFVQWKNAAKENASKSKMPQSFSGNAPNINEGWSYVGSCCNKEPDHNFMLNWDIWCQSQTELSDWIKIKVVAQNNALRKANYWMGYNFQEKRISNGIDARLMQTGRPGLLEVVVDFLNVNYQKIMKNN